MSGRLPPASIQDLGMFFMWDFYLSLYCAALLAAKSRHDRGSAPTPQSQTSAEEGTSGVE